MYSKHIEMLCCEAPVYLDKAKLGSGPKAQIPAGQPQWCGRIKSIRNNSFPIVLHSKHTGRGIGAGGLPMLACEKYRTSKQSGLRPRNNPPLRNTQSDSPLLRVLLT